VTVLEHSLDAMVRSSSCCADETQARHTFFLCRRWRLEGIKSPSARCGVLRASTRSCDRSDGKPAESLGMRGNCTEMQMRAREPDVQVPPFAHNCLAPARV
jgi:hypothetical protein